MFCEGSVLTGNSNLFAGVLSSPELQSMLRHGEKGGALSIIGVSEVGKPFLLLALACAAGQPLAVVSSSAKQQEHLFSELSALLALAPNTITLLPFPENDPLPSSSKIGTLPDLEARAEMISTLLKLRSPGEGIPIVVATDRSYGQPVPAPKALQIASRVLKIGDTCPMDSLASELIAHGYEKETQVAGRGQFARHGGILDLFPFQGESPVRVEFLGDEIVSMRSFEPDSQVSISPLVEVTWTALPEISHSEPARLHNYLPLQHLLWREPVDPKDPIRIEWVSPKVQNSNEPETMPVEIFGHDFLKNVPLDPVLYEQHHLLVTRHWKNWLSDGWQVAVCCNNEGEEQRLREWIQGDGLSEQTLWLRSPLLQGFTWPALKLAVLSDAEIFGRYQTLQMARLQRTTRVRAKRESIDFSQFKLSVESNIIMILFQLLPKQPLPQSRPFKILKY